MKLYINARFLSQPVSGVQRYGIECCRKIKKKHKECIILTPPGIYNKEVADELGAKVIGRNNGHLWEQLDLPLYLARQGSPRLFNPCNTAPLLYRNNYITLHDLAFHHHPEWNSKKFAAWYNILVPRIVRGSKHIFTVSQTIKNEIIAAYRTPAAAISVTYNGISGAMLVHPATPVPKEKIILSVGSFARRKNHHTLISAFCQSNLGSRYQLVITGDKSKVFSETGIDEEELRRSNIVVLKNLPEDELIRMYQRAEIVVSLSLYEGFGIPVLEGLYFGAKVLCSDIPVYREIYGNTVAYCNPLDAVAVADAISALETAAGADVAAVAALCEKYNYDAAADVILGEMMR